MDYDYVAAEQNLSAYGVVDDHHHHRGGEDDEYDEENQREDYYSEHGLGLGGGGGGEMGPMDSIGDSGNAGHDLKHSMDDSSAGKLFVGGIAWETSEESFNRYFSKFGELTDSVIMMDKISGRPRGFGFVTFADAEAANKVLDEEHVIDGRTVEVKRTVPREDMQSRGGGGGISRTKKIFIGGIPLSLSEDDLREYFSAYGKVVEHQIMLDHKTGRSRGFGFVTFDSEEAVEKIFVDGQMHELGGKQVEIKRAEPKRSGFDHSGDSRMRRGGSISRSYGGYGAGAGASDGFGGGYGKMGRGYGAGAGAGAGAGYGGFGGYGGYGNYPGNYGAGAAGFYGGFGGYGYGFGFGGPMYGGGAGYGAGGYGNPAAAGGYGAGAASYGAGGRGYGGAGYDGGKGYGASGSAAGYGATPKGYSGGSGGGDRSGSSGHGGSKGYRGGAGSGGGGADGGRFHPYRK